MTVRSLFATQLYEAGLGDAALIAALVGVFIVLRDIYRSESADFEIVPTIVDSSVEEAQQKIVNIIRKLEDSAEIIISRGGGDEIIV